MSMKREALTAEPEEVAVAPSARDERWFLIAPHALPEEWRDRAIPVFMVNLADEDVLPLMSRGDLRDQLDAEEKAVAELAAKGIAPHQMATMLHLSRRSVFRRLAHLRQLTGSETNAELATKLAKEDI